MCVCVYTLFYLYTYVFSVTTKKYRNQPVINTSTVFSDSKATLTHRGAIFCFRAHADRLGVEIGFEYQIQSRFEKIAYDLNRRCYDEYIYIHIAAYENFFFQNFVSRFVYVYLPTFAFR